MTRRIFMVVLASVLVAPMLPGVATAKDKGKSVCKKGGWMELVDADGEPFANQGACAKYATQGGTPMPPMTVLALAYINVDGLPGYSPPIDRLIAQFEDVDGDGTPSAGDIIRTDKYPKLLGTSVLGQFELTAHVIPAIFSASYTAEELRVSFDDGNGGAEIVWNHQASDESYVEYGAGDGSWFIDRFDAASFEDVNAERQSPSLPLEYATDFAPVADPADNDWTNVVITPPVVPPPVATPLAIAYTDVDPSDGAGFKDGTDRLIAKLVDTNGDEVVSVGDTVVTGEYPKDFGYDTAGFGNFGVTSHPVTELFPGAGEFAVLSGGLDKFFVWDETSELEVYSEYDRNNAPTTYTEFTDVITESFIFVDSINVNQVSPSLPADNVSKSREQTSDDGYLDIDLITP